MERPDPILEHDATPAAATGSRLAFTVLTLVFAAGSLGGLFGVGLVIGWFDPDAGGIHRVHDIGFGVLFGVILTVALASMARRPEAKVSSFFTVVAAAAATAISALVSFSVEYLITTAAVGLVAVVLLALHPARTAVLRPRTNPSRPMVAFVAAATVPLVWFGLTAARLQRDGLPFDPHVQMGHWATMAAMAFGLVLVGLLASLRLRGWRITAWSAGLGAAVYGLASIVFARFPGTSIPYPGSVGDWWGSLAMVGGLAFVALGEWEAKRSR
jgi:hypothetical protein